MFKRLLTAIICLLVTATAVTAAPVQPPYPVFFWIAGTLNAGSTPLTAADLAGFNCYFYNDPEDYQDHYAMSVSVDGGTFAVNGLADVGMSLEAGTYYMATEQKIVDGVVYGMNPVELVVTDTDLANGYILLPNDFAVIVEGGGLVPPETLTEGAVILNITRSGSDLTITWEINTVNFPSLTGNEQVDIYYMVIDSGAAGQYDKAGLTQLIIDGDALVSGAPAGFSLSAPRTITWSGQVGTGYQEAYFAGCINDQASHADYGLAAAVAVGKVNYTINQGFNAISIPFAQPTGDNTLVNVLGSQLDGGTSDTADQVMWKDVSTSWGMKAAYLSDGTVGETGQWYWSNDPTVPATIPIDPENGYLVVHIASAQKNITMVGKVIEATTIYMNNGFNLIGTVFPRTVPLNDLGLIDVDNVQAGNSDTADQIMLKDDPGSWGMKAAYLSDGSFGTTAGQWYLSSSPTTPVDFDLYMKYGYFYVMQKDGVQIQWQRTSP